MSDWGQGAKNNDIGWGQGAVNNDIGWGAVHADSWSGDTDIVGLDPIETIINAFEERVSSDGGTFEAESCLNTTLTELNNEGLLEEASLVITPNAVEEGKLFSIVPTDGSGDLSVVRATTKTRVNSLGVIESVPINVAALDYSNGSCPSILVEPQRTNLLTNSDGNLATYATNSNVSDAVIPINGFTNSIQFGDNSVSRIAYKRNFTPTIAIQYTLSVFVQMDDNSLPIIGPTNSTGDFSLIINGNIANINVLAQRVNDTNVYKCSASFVAISTTNTFGVVKYSTQSAKGFIITGIQLEAGANATSYIPTGASAVTRNADVISKTGISDLIGQTEGTLFANFSQNLGSRILALRSNNSQNRIALRITSSTNLGVEVVSQGSVIYSNSANVSLTSNTFFKILVTYTNTKIKMFVNGLLVLESGVVNFSPNEMLSILALGISELNFSTSSLNGSIKEAVVFKKALTDDQCINLTTL